MRTHGMMRGAAALAVAASSVILAATPAHAHVDGPCDGYAIIKGRKYTPANDTPGNPVHLPDKGLAQYHGQTGSVTAPHHGNIAVVVGPAEITVYSWNSRNDRKKLTDDGTQNLKKAYDKLPFGIAGLYKIKGYHYNDGTLYCSGFAYVKFDKSPLTTPVGAGALAGTVVTAGGVVLAARGRRVRS